MNPHFKRTNTYQPISTPPAMGLMPSIRAVREDHKVSLWVRKTQGREYKFLMLNVKTILLPVVFVYFVHSQNAAFKAKSKKVR